MKFYFLIQILFIGIMLSSNSGFGQIDFNKDFQNNTNYKVNDVEIILQGLENITNYYSGFSWGYHFHDFTWWHDGSGNTVLRWWNPFHGDPFRHPECHPENVPPGGIVHLGFSVADTHAVILDMCFTLDTIPIGQVTQVVVYPQWTHTDGIIIGNNLDTLCGPRPQYYIGNVFVEYYYHHIPLEDLNNHQQRQPIRRDSVGLQPIPLLRGQQIEIPLPQNSPSGTNYVLWIFDVDTEPSLQSPNMSRDFIEYPLLKGSIKGMKFRDRNGNGAKDPEDEPLKDWTIRINGPVNRYMITDVNGNYAFYDLPVGEYILSEDVPYGWIPSLPITGSYNINLLPGENITGMNFGNCRKSRIHGIKFDDYFGDGKLDEIDLSLTGWKINCVDLLRQTATTDCTVHPTGYFFSNLLPGLYRISEDQQEGWLQTAPVEGAVVVGIATDDEDWELNFGNFKKVCVRGYKFWDRNRNGARDEGEEGLAEWTIRLYGQEILVTQTNQNGYYEFCNLIPREYTICEQIIDGWMPTCDTCYSFTAMSGVDLNFDFCNYREKDSIKYRTIQADSLEEIACLKLKPAKLWTSKKQTIPNLANLLEKVNPILVGKSGGDPKKGPPYLFTPKYKDIMKSLCEKGIKHNGTPRGFDISLKNKLLKGRYKSMSPVKVINNNLLKEIIALKVSIIASDMGITPNGLGDLVYYLPGQMFDGISIRELADTADYYMTNWEFKPIDVYTLLDTLIKTTTTAIGNSVIWKKSAWQSGRLEMPGVRPVTDIPFLRPPAPGGVTQWRPREFVEETVPEVFKLEQNYPNPFNPITTIQFSLPEDAIVTLYVYNTLGQLVTTLIDHEEFYAGVEEITFDASPLPSGIYFYRLRAQTILEEGIGKTFNSVNKMILIK